MSQDLLKYASFMLMGLYIYNRTKGQGLGSDYQMLHQKADNMIAKVNINPQLADQIKAITKNLIDRHMGVRSINGKK